MEHYLQNQLYFQKNTFATGDIANDKQLLCQWTRMSLDLFGKCQNSY